MKKKLLTWSFVTLAIASLITGYSFSSHFRHNILQKPPKTVVGIEAAKQVVAQDTRIIYEKEYLKCHHSLVTGFDDKKKIVGLDYPGLKKYFKADKGYSVSFNENTLIIHQSINDYCPEDQGQFKLKEHRGYVAVYTGAEENEILLRVTAIRLNLLPANIQRDIRQGKYCFQDEANLNDTLENLDEYI